ncbi:hypothetical protein EfmJHP10_03640 [Enterococcus faecium]|nr:hypothetical protein EfmJHP10_03640 [Enterococcus faecium]
MKHLSVDILIYSIRRKKQGKHSSAKICLPACSFSKKPQPDYLPIYKETKDNKYDRYNEEILENETTFIKTHPGGLLTIKWKNTGDKTVHIPVIVYDRTVLQQNGKTLTDYEVTDIGTPIVKQQKGINELTLHYQTPIYFYFILSLTLIGWFTLLCLFIYHRYKHLRA